MARVGDQIKKEVSQIVQRDLRDPGIGFVTITEVEVSPDLKHALVYYSVLGTEEQKERSDSALRRAAGFVQQQIGQRIRMKYLPVLEFKYDQSAEYGDKIDRLLDQIHREDEKRD